MKPITEAELRQTVRERLEKRAARGGRVQEELTIEQGGARADLALCGNLLEAYELKSDSDSFARLHNQIHAYNRVFDRITLVITEKHEAAALAIAPYWWGIWCAARLKSGNVIIDQRRRAQAHQHQDPYSLASLLWRDEAAALLNDAGLGPIPSRTTRVQLYERLSVALGFERLREHVMDALAQRKASAAA